MEEPTAAVCAFIDAHIESIDALRVLLCLARQPETAWTAAAVGTATNLPEDTVAAIMQRLTSAGLLATVAESAGEFRYAPRADEFRELVAELIALDDRRPVTLIRLVYARKSSSAQAFADAFRLRRN